MNTHVRLKSTFGSEDFLIEKVKGIHIIKVNVIRATIREAEEFKQKLNSIILAEHYKIIIDFTNCHYVDSVIVGVMLTVVKTIRKNNGDILAITPPGSINNIFAQTGLDKIFKQFDTRENAIASFS